jgi:hypothetical protein
MSHSHPSAARGRDDESRPWCYGSLTTFEHPKPNFREPLYAKFAE